MRRRAFREAAVRDEKVYREIEAVGCATVSALMERLKVGRSELKHTLHRLRQEGRVVSVSLGRAALWCAGEDAAEEVLANLGEALRRLLCRFKYASPKKALRLIAKDPEAKRLFSRHMSLRRSSITIQLIDALLERTFGRKPMRTSRGNVYTVQCDDF
jgi:hypothetical protein